MFCWDILKSCCLGFGRGCLGELAAKGWGLRSRGDLRELATKGLRSRGGLRSREGLVPSERLEFQHQMFWNLEKLIGNWPSRVRV